MTDEEIKKYADDMWRVLTGDGLTLADILGVCVVVLGMTRHVAIESVGNRILKPEEIQ